MKQCSRCLRFLPDACFAKQRAHLASLCNGCTNQRDPKPWIPNPAPLAQALKEWKQ